MLILILGANNFCHILASELCKEGHDICVISEHATLLEHLQQYIDCQTIVGCPSHPQVLRQANADNADMIIAATQNDEMNMVACQVAYSLFSIKRKIAFISNAHYLVRHELFSNNNMPIDTMVSIENIISEQLSELLAFSTGYLHTDFPHSNLCMTLTTVLNPKFCGIYLANLTDKISTIAIFRDNEYLEAKQDTILQEGDQIIFLSDKHLVRKLAAEIHGPTSDCKRIMIGADPGVIDDFLRIHSNLQTKVIEPCVNNCEIIANKHPTATVLNGDITEYELLCSENMKKIDVFCAITGDDEDNIMAALQAKDLGADKTIAMVSKKHYQNMLNNSTIDFILDPNDRVLEQVLTHVKHPWIKNVHKIPLNNHKIVELYSTYEINKSQLKDFRVIAYINGTEFEPEDIIPSKTTILIHFENDISLSVFENSIP